MLTFANSKLDYRSVHRNHKDLTSAHLWAAQALEAKHAPACEPDIVVHTQSSGTEVMVCVDGGAQVEGLRQRADVIARAE